MVLAKHDAKKESCVADVKIENKFNHRKCDDSSVYSLWRKCSASVSFGSKVDCCYNATPGDEHFSTAVNPCGEKTKVIVILIISVKIES